MKQLDRFIHRPASWWLVLIERNRIRTGYGTMKTDTMKQDAAKSAKAQRTADKATLKMHDDVTTSLEQLEHPGIKAKNEPEKVKPGVHKRMTGEEKIVAFHQHKHAEEDRKQAEEDAHRVSFL